MHATERSGLLRAVLLERTHQGTLCPADGSHTLPEQYLIAAVVEERKAWCEVPTVTDEGSSRQEAGRHSREDEGGGTGEPWVGRQDAGRVEDRVQEGQMFQGIDCHGVRGLLGLDAFPQRQRLDGDAVLLRAVGLQNLPGAGKHVRDAEHVWRVSQAAAFSQCGTWATASAAWRCTSPASRQGCVGVAVPILGPSDMSEMMCANYFPSMAPGVVAGLCSTPVASLDGLAPQLVTTACPSHPISHNSS